MNSLGYFAAQPAQKAVNDLMRKMDDWSNILESNGYLEKLRSLYTAYHGSYYGSVGNGHQITFGGEQGELVQLPVNHLRNIAQHILNMTCTNRPSMECRASNTDYTSLVQTTLANNILEYYVRDKKLDTILRNAVEFAIVFGSGFVKMEWNSNGGEIYDYIEETNTPIYEGDIDFCNMTPFDVVFDGSKENQNHDWVLCRSFKNKYDLSAKYPELKDKIEGLATKSDMQKFRIGLGNLIDKTDDVPVYEFYHKKTDSMPQGRYMLFLDSDVVLSDTPLPYKIIPLFRISAGEIMGTPYGYTPMMDILPIQQAVNSLYSTVLTNQNAFGVQNILCPANANIDVEEIVGGLNLIKYDNITTGGAKPEPLKLLNTPDEVFKFIDMLKSEMETISGVNSVARGNPEASLRSGTALALVQAQALQFMSGLQQSYVKLIEDVGTAIIKILQDYAAAPRLIAIAGKTNRSYMKEFSSNDIENISRVVVTMGNELAKTTSGRVQMATELIQYGEITPKQYVSVINTGNLEQFTEDNEHEELLMRAENEKIVDGEIPVVTVVDNHVEHIKFHKAVFADPDLRKDANLVQRATAHIQEHINQLRTADPQLLQVLGQQPLQPPPPPVPGPAGPPGPTGQVGPQGAPGAPHPAAQQVMQPPPEGQMGIQQQGDQIQGPNLPPINLPQLPTVPANLLSNPGVQQQALGNVKQ